MTKKFLGLFVLSAFVLTSCKKELVPQDSAETPITSTEEKTIAPTTEATNMVAPQTTVQPTQVVTQAPTKTAPGMNPPHGQAGHDCGIAVGAPLNSKRTPPPSTPSPSPTITTTQSNTSTAPAILNPNAQTVTAPGMNPPHGQAGHDCAVAVGAPLPKK